MPTEPVGLILADWRDEARYGIYEAPRDKLAHPTLIATVPEKEGIGTCLVTLHEEGQIDGDTRVGILDGETGKWITNPWARGRAK